MLVKLDTNALRSILKNIHSIALIGASSNPERDSYKVMKYLNEKGYKVYPVNPNEVHNKIQGKKCFSNLKEIEQKIDMVDIFRSKEFVMDITQDAIEVGVDLIWTQEGIFDEKAAKIATNAGIIFVMDRCPKKVLEN